MEEEKEELSLLDLISYHETGPVLKERPNDVLRTPSHPEELNFNYVDDDEIPCKSLTRKAKLAKMQKKALGLTDIPGGSPPGAQGYRPRSSYEQQDFQTSHTTGFGGPSVIDVEEDKPPSNINRRQRKKPINISFKTETDNFFSFLETGRLRRRRKRVGATMNTEQRELTKLAKALRLSGYNEQAGAIIRLAAGGFAPDPLSSEKADWVSAVTAATDVITKPPMSLGPDAETAADTHGAKALFDAYISHLLTRVKTRLETSASGGLHQCNPSAAPLVPCGLTSTQVSAIHSALETAWKAFSIDSYKPGDLNNSFVGAFDSNKGLSSGESGIAWLSGGKIYDKKADANLVLLQELKKKEKGGAVGGSGKGSGKGSGGGSVGGSGGGSGGSRMADYTGQYIKNRDTGNDFRDWVHSSGNLEAVNAQIVADNSKRTDGLDKGSSSASWSNGYMWSAWKAVGEKYKRSRTGRENKPEGEGTEQRGGSLSPGSEDQELPLKAYLQAPMGKALGGDEVHNLPLAARNRLLRAVGSVGRTRRDGEDPPIVPADDGLRDTLLSDQFKAHVEEAYFEDAADDPYYGIKLKRLMRDGGGRRGRRRQLAGAATGDGGEINRNDYVIAGDIWFKKSDASVWFKTSYPAANAKEKLPDNSYTIAPIASRDGWPGQIAPYNVGYLEGSERKAIISALGAEYPTLTNRDSSKSGGHLLEALFSGQQQATRGGVFNTDSHRAKGVEKRDKARRGLQSLLTPLLGQADRAEDLRDLTRAARANDHVLVSMGNEVRKRRINALRKNSI